MNEKDKSGHPTHLLFMKRVSSVRWLLWRFHTNTWVCFLSSSWKAWICSYPIFLWAVQHERKRQVSGNSPQIRSKLKYNVLTRYHCNSIALWPHTNLTRSWVQCFCLTDKTQHEKRDRESTSSSIPFLMLNKKNGKRFLMLVVSVLVIN